VQALENKQAYVYLDLGPSGTLANFVKYNLASHSQSKSFPILTPFGQSLPNLEKVKDFLSAIPPFTPKPSKGTSTKTEILANATERRKKQMITWVFPGQGSQEKGMGATLFDSFADLTAQADAILGYSIKVLCLDEPQKQLSQTQYT
jgi:trans-AT polyketide synthase/acyltransferase/oxidoreductase domain-containing protein